MWLTCHCRKKGEIVGYSHIAYTKARQVWRLKLWVTDTQSKKNCLPFFTRLWVWIRRDKEIITNCNSVSDFVAYWNFLLKQSTGSYGSPLELNKKMLTPIRFYRCTTDSQSVITDSQSVITDCESVNKDSKLRIRNSGLRNRNNGFWILNNRSWICIIGLEAHFLLALMDFRRIGSVLICSIVTLNLYTIGLPIAEKYFSLKWNTVKYWRNSFYSH